MKDKKCTDFVFMPLGDKASTPRPQGKGQKDGSSDRLAPVLESDTARGGGKEVRSKIVVVGSCKCGKTALIQRYVHSTFVEAYTPTGFDTYTSVYSVSETYKIHMSIWDTSGHADYDRVRPLSYGEADLVIICFAIDSPESMADVVNKWYPEVREHCPTQPVVLVGCKSDRRNEIKGMSPDVPKPSFITYDQGLKTAKLIKALVYSETSSKTLQRSVNDVMEVAALSSAGSKSGSGCSSGNTTTASNSSTASSATTNSSNSSGGSADRPHFHRNRSFIRRKGFSGMAEAKTHLRKEAAKSCVVM